MGKHRAKRSTRRTASRPALGVAAIAVAGAAALGVAPTLSVSPDLMASLHYLRGTNIGAVPTNAEFVDFIDEVLEGAGVDRPEGPYQKVPYNAGFRPFSRGGFQDLTYDASIVQGVQLLDGQNPAPGDIIFGFSQGAVAASAYKGGHTGHTYVLVANPSRANGGVLQRFKGMKLPLVDVTFGGATPNNGDFTVDVARQYDGWADFPAYLWNPVAVANALLGIALIHGDTQWELTAEDLEAARGAGSDHYQFDADSNTAYYVIRTYPVPLLMPLQPLLPASWIAALDAPLRAFIETAYDRSDYSDPTRASLFPPLRPRVAESTVAGPTVSLSVADVGSTGPKGEVTDEAAEREVDDDSAEPTEAGATEVEVEPTDEPDDVPSATGPTGGRDASRAAEPERRAADRDRSQRREAADQQRRQRGDAA
ncbi:PE-PPE domain-containing protein [Mycolicibacterium vaccae]|uniref:PE-PPE domain-containing protein n=1 Tax=Mycolicibacterium vaccae TaxID=1810 RepID=UPI003D00B822